MCRIFRILPENDTEDKKRLLKFFSKGVFYGRRGGFLGMKMVKLNQNRDFRRVYAKGKYAAHPLIVTYALKNRTGQTRIGVTASKKVGNAVQRNRARRIITAAFWPLQEQIKKGYDLVLVARAKTPLAKSTAIEPVLQKHLQKLGILENDQTLGTLADTDVSKTSV